MLGRLRVVVAHTGRDVCHRPPPRRAARLRRPRRGRRGRRTGRRWSRGSVVGILTGLSSLAVVLAPVVMAWLVEPLATGNGWHAMGTGAALWLLISGAQLAPVGHHLARPPPGLALLVAVACSGRARRWSTSPPTASTGGARCRARSPPRWVPGGRGTPSPSRAPSACRRGAVPGHAAVARAARGGRAAAGARARPAAGGPRRPRRARSAAGFAWLPDAVRRAVRPGLVGAGVLLGVGCRRGPRDGRACPGTR